MVYCHENPRAVSIRKEIFSIIRYSVRTFAEDKGQYKPYVESLADDYIFSQEEMHRIYGEDSGRQVN